MQSLTTFTGTLVVTSATWVWLLATKIDIPTALFFLVFFSIFHAVFISYQRRQDINTPQLIWIDFCQLMFIACGIGVFSMMVWILRGYDELTLYILASIGAIVWIEWPWLILAFIKKSLQLPDQPKND